MTRTTPSSLAVSPAVKNMATKQELMTTRHPKVNSRSRTSTTPPIGSTRKMAEDRSTEYTDLGSSDSKSPVSQVSVYTERRLQNQSAHVAVPAASDYTIQT